MSHTGETELSLASICSHTAIISSGHGPDTVPERLIVSPCAHRLSPPQLGVMEAAVNWQEGVGIGVAVAVGVGVASGICVSSGIGEAAGVSAGKDTDGVGVMPGTGVGVAIVVGSTENGGGETLVCGTDVMVGSGSRMDPASGD